MKGVSAIIATILMLIITIGLAGTAYVYISGVMTTRTAVTLSISDASCTGIAVGDTMSIVTMNDGTADSGTGFVIYIEGADRSAICAEVNVPARGSAVQLCTVGAVGQFSSGTNDILIVHPSSSARGIAYC